MYVDSPNQQLHRAIVTFTNPVNGEIRVKIPAVTGLAEVSISQIGRKQPWVLPAVGETIVVGADDDNMTNIFWVQTNPIIVENVVRSEALVLIKKVVLDSTGKNQVLVDDVFSSQFRNYKIILDGITTVSNGSLDFNFRDITGNISTQYRGMLRLYTSTGTNIFIQYEGVTGSSILGVGFMRGADFGNSSFDVRSPNLPIPSSMSGQYGGDHSGWFGGGCRLNTQMTGFRISSPATFTTGQISVYGYGNGS
jgi:hypothetical protein